MIVSVLEYNSDVVSFFDSDFNFNDYYCSCSADGADGWSDEDVFKSLFAMSGPVLGRGVGPL